MFMRYGASLFCVLVCGAMVLGQDQPGADRGSTRGPGGFSRPAPAARPLPADAGKLISYDILIAERAEPLAEPTADKIVELDKAGKLGATMHIQLAALEEQSSTVTFGELAARVVGRTTSGVASARGGPGGATGGGFGGAPPRVQSTPIYNDINVGTTAQVIARVESDGSIVTQLTLERSGLPASARDPAVLDDDPPPSVTR